MASYSSQPAPPTIRMPQEAPPPAEVGNWLAAFGWQCAGDLWYKSGQFGNLYYTWSEAIALESLRVMTVGNL